MFKSSKRKTISDFFCKTQSQTHHSSEADNTDSCATKRAKEHFSDSDDTYQQYKIFRYDEKFQAQNVPADGSCFFSALAHQLHKPLQAASAIRKELVEFIRDNQKIVVSNELTTYAVR
jgi:hypothetical protein